MIDYTPWNVTDYQKIFIDESKQLIEIFRNEIVEIHHFGSTAVKGLPGNQSLDILPVVKNIEKIEQYVEAMMSVGYHMTTFSVYADERCKVFIREINGLTRVILMVERTDFDAIDRRLAVRDYLRMHPEIRKSYADLKQKLAFQFTGDYQGYKNAKDEFVSFLEQDAVNWYKTTKR
ncbi:GrpB family protein [Macrococcus lamae]|uniref:GrpB family protein n=1 Tax=Macrococcus lamae TaxID=198484 RepID=A0A4R6BUS8_9STAP|nr:GrpB family protein [Macrococcus lamae]TDM12066.1 GrpB family protein [Macrococcus lamae]